MRTVVCGGCKRTPDEIEEYIEAAAEAGEGMTPTLYVVQEEGTYSPESGRFLCTECYIKKGMPSSPAGWKCP